MSRVPPNLEYLVVYNKAIQATHNASKDDDDAQEEAHILFYTCRPGGVKRDKMLRQVGLAKALISFSEAFTNGNSEACEMIHSARTKLVMISPEPDYWIHACVNLAYTETKNKDGTVKKEYQEASVHDIVLKAAVSRGYQEFRLLYGPFSDSLAKGRETLERRLEKFYSVWAWKWELEQPADFVSHLGTPLSPYNKYLTSLLEEARTLVPEGTPVLLLSSQDVLASYPPPSSSLWSMLPLHLMKLIPSHDPTPSGAASPSNPARAVVKANNHEGKLASQSNMDTIIQVHGTSNATATANFLNAMNPKKWGDFLTFSGKSRSKPPTAQEIFSAPPVEASGSGPVKTDPAAPKFTSLPTPSRPEVDQKSLEDAISSSVPVERTIGRADRLDPRYTSSASTTPPVPLFAPALDYLSHATGSLFGALSLTTAPANEGAENSDKLPGDADTSTREQSKVAASNETQDTAGVVLETSTENRDPDQPKGEGDKSQQNEDTLAQQSLKDALEKGTTEDSPADPQRVADKLSPDLGPINAEVPQKSSPSAPSSRRLSDASIKSAAAIHPPDAFFVPLSVYLEDEKTKKLRVERVYHMTFNGIMLALIVQSSETPISPTDTSTISSRRFASFGGLEVLEGLGYPAYVDLPRGLEYKVVEILRRAKESLEKSRVDRGEGKGVSHIEKLKGQSPSQPYTSATVNGMRNFAITSTNVEADSVLASLGFSSTAGWLFEGQSALRRNSEILEQFSRTTTSQSWFISKRVPAADAAGYDREVHMEISRKDANLVDVDNDLATIVRRLDTAAS